MAAGPAWWAKLEVTDAARGQVVREVFLGPIRPGRGRVWRSTLLHVPRAADSLALLLFSQGSRAAAVPEIRLRGLGRIGAALLLLAHGYAKLPRALRGKPLGLAGRVRAVLGQAVARGGEAPPYAAWIALFDRWGAAERAALAQSAESAETAESVQGAESAERAHGAQGAVTIEIAVVDHGDAPALAATLASIAAQWVRPGGAGLAVIRAAADWRGLRGAWIVVLDAGEILAPHALACFGHAIGRAGSITAICADIDHVGTDGQRYAPSFRPNPDPWSLLSNFYADGAWAFHRNALGAAWASLKLDAAASRLDLARKTPRDAMQRLPLILTQCRCPPRIDAPQADAPPPLVRSAPRVSIIVPSACRSRHVLHCLRRVLQRTDYPDFEILLAVSTIDPDDAVQSRILRRAADLPHVRVIDLGMPDFNYAAVNTKAASQASGALLLLLNDDVVPIEAGWLTAMVAHVGAPGGLAADIVGARLLYANGMVQHGGVIMGLANLCEHAFRLTDREDPGPHGVARLDRQVSAVTAACMLVRREVFEALHGMDAAFAIALNDVDFCLRAGALGARIVYAAGVELYHFESLSLGRHYRGARAGLEAIEVRRLGARWAGVIAADPFYNPCASLEPGREFQPAFPPRQTPLSWIGQAGAEPR